MTHSSDSGGDMRDEQPLDDPFLTDFFTELRSWGAVEPPVPTEVLATLLAADDPIEPVRPVPAAPARRKNMLVAKLAGLGIAAKVALGAGVAAAAVTTAGATGVLPAPAQHGVAVAVNAISPLEFPDLDAKVKVAADVTSDVTLPTTTIPGDDGVVGDDESTGTDDEAQANHGACVSEVARDKGLSGREHGQAVAAIAKSDCGKEDETPTSTTTSTTTTTTTLLEADETGESNLDRGPSGNPGPGNSGGNGNGNGNSGNAKGNSGKS